MITSDCFTLQKLPVPFPSPVLQLQIHVKSGCNLGYFNLAPPCSWQVCCYRQAPGPGLGGRVKGMVQIQNLKPSLYFCVSLTGPAAALHHRADCAQSLAIFLSIDNQLSAPVGLFAVEINYVENNLNKNKSCIFTWNCIKQMRWSFWLHKRLVSQITRPFQRVLNDHSAELLLCDFFSAEGAIVHFFFYTLHSY